ncbi:MAG: methyl-accepting chemotaxis protein, partial [Alphaproteobacteria bacterium]|nr:methyl-accepting chemotaxis protein [Alphaproteobacteria bacterium]
MLKLLNNLSIRVRMSLSIALFLATLCFSMFSAYTGIGANVDFAAQEKKGDAYQRPLALLLHDTGRLRIELIKTRAGTGSPEAVTDLLDSIESAMGRLESVQNEIGAALQFTRDGLESRGREALKIENVSAKWTALEQSIRADKTADLDERVASYIADLRGMISHSGDTSNLILDPDLDSYYLMDVTLLALPQTMDRLSVIGSTLYPILRQETLTPGQRTEAAVMSRMLSESDIARIVGDMDTSLKEDKNFYGLDSEFQDAGAKLVKDYEAKNKAVVDLLDTIARGDKVEAMAFAAAVDTAQKSSYDFLAKGYDHLDRLLDTRIKAYRHQQSVSIAVSLAGIVLSGVFFFVVVWTITHPLARLTNAMKKIAEGDFETKVDYTDSKSEIGHIANSIQIFKENGMQMEALKADEQKRELAAQEEKKKLMADLTQNFETSVGNIVSAVSEASDKLHGNATKLSDTSMDTSQKAVAVAAASEKTTSNVQIVAAAAEELSACIREISERVERASEMVHKAVGQGGLT